MPLLHHVTPLQTEIQLKIEGALGIPKYLCHYQEPLHCQRDLFWLEEAKHKQPGTTRSIPCTRDLNLCLLKRVRCQLKMSDFASSCERCVVYR